MVLFTSFVLGLRIKHKKCLGSWKSMNQNQYKESRRRWSKALTKRTAIDALKMAAVVSSFLIGLVGTVLFLYESYPLRVK